MNKDLKRILIFIIAFVGISHKILDACKQNRGIFVSRFDPRVEDLKKISLKIWESYCSAPNENLIEKLSKTYYEYKNNSLMMHFQIIVIFVD